MRDALVPGAALIERVLIMSDVPSLALGDLIALNVGMIFPAKVSSRPWQGLRPCMDRHSRHMLLMTEWAPAHIQTALCLARRAPGRRMSTGQRGETIIATVACRIRLAWNGSWGLLWEESADALAQPGTGQVSDA